MLINYVDNIFITQSAS